MYGAGDFFLSPRTRAPLPVNFCRSFLIYRDAGAMLCDTILIICL